MSASKVLFLRERHFLYILISRKIAMIVCINPGETKHRRERMNGQSIMIGFFALRYEPTHYLTGSSLETSPRIFCFRSKFTHDNSKRRQTAKMNCNIILSSCNPYKNPLGKQSEDLCSQLMEISAS